MTFANPQWLNALFLLPILILLVVHGSKKRRRELMAFTGSRLGESLAPGRSWRKSMLKTVLKLGAFTLLVLALARPQFGKQLVKVEREGIDLVIALDTSLSMLAEDMKPNRLERAKHEIVDLIDGLKGDRVGVVAFAGDAFVLCPLTVDYGAALMFTRTADIGMVSTPGSALDDAIHKSLSLFQPTAKNDKVIILVTDGESHDREPIKAARAAAESDVRIYTIGIGNPAGELIPLRGTDGSTEGYKKDDRGETVLTRLDEGTLREIAQVTGGKYLPATRQGLELTVLYREIAGMERRIVEGEFVERKMDRFTLFLALSFALLGLDLLVNRKRSMKRASRQRILHTGTAAAIALLVLLPPRAASADRIDRGKVKSGNQYFDAGEFQKALALYREALRDSTKRPKHAEGVLYNQANALHMIGDYPEALRKYQESFAEDSLHAARMFFNRGNTLAAMDDLDEAVESYIGALQYAPDDEDTRYNLELALRRLEEQQQQQEQRQDQQQDSEESENEEGQDNQNQGQNQEQDQSQDGEDGQQQPDSSQTNPPSQPDSSQAKSEAQPQTMQLSREDAMRILQLIEEQEKELQKKKRKAAFRSRGRAGKDW